MAENTLERLATNDGSITQRQMDRLVQNQSEYNEVITTQKFMELGEKAGENALANFMEGSTINETHQ